MNIAVDVNATFNTLGEIKPRYILIENPERKLETCKVIRIVSRKDDQLSGADTLLFYCIILLNNQEKEILLRYYLGLHKWILIK